MLKHEVVQLTNNIRVNSGTVSQRTVANQKGRQERSNKSNNPLINTRHSQEVRTIEAFIVIERHMTQTDKRSVGKITINYNI